MAKIPTDLLQTAQALKALMTMILTHAVGEDREYQQLRETLVTNSLVRSKVPECVNVCRSIPEFVCYTKGKGLNENSIREFLRVEFNPLLSMLELTPVEPGAAVVTESIKRWGADHVRDLWQKALERGHTDPAAAITAARSLLEGVCKHILDEAEVEYSPGDELQRLYSKAANCLELAPQKETEAAIRKALTGCVSIIEGIGALRNSAGDAHGKGRGIPTPDKAVAQFGVSVAGATSAFLVETWLAQKPRERSFKALRGVDHFLADMREVSADYQRVKEKRTGLDNVSE